MSASEAAGQFPNGLLPLPRDADGPAFPAPWAARAFAITVALNDRGLFGWSEWAAALGAAIAAEEAKAQPADAEAYWRAWLAALEAMLARKQVAGPAELKTLQEAWRHAAEQTPHGQAIELPLAV